MSTALPRLVEFPRVSQLETEPRRVTPYPLNSFTWETLHPGTEK